MVIRKLFAVAVMCSVASGCEPQDGGAGSRSVALHPPKSPDVRPGALPSKTTLPSTAKNASPKKLDASTDGLAEASRDIELLKATFPQKSPEDLIASFIPSTSPRHYGGYDYYFNFMANIEIRKELRSRGHAAKEALEKHLHDQTRIWEAVSGPGDTIGRICADLLRSL